MTKEEAAAIWPVMKAFAEGREVQNQAPNGSWRDSESPHFNPGLNWRVAPEKREIRGWVNVYRDGLTLYRRTREQADKESFDRIACVEVRGEYEVPADQ